jgi:nucleoside-diphosphate-sugar epimerase
MPGVVAVTGATGFIGQALVQALLKNKWKVRALARQTQTEINGLQWVIGDLENKKSLTDLVANVDVIIHCAGQVRGNTFSRFLKTNAHGTENLLNAASLQNKHPRLLLISSLAAREPELSWYAQSKFQGEQVLKSLGNELDWTIIRPTAVYGPGDKELSPLFKLTKIGLLPMTGASSSKFGLIYIDDLVQAICDCVSSDLSHHKTYELDDGTSGGYDSYRIKTIACQVWGHPVYIVRVPLFLIQCLANINLVLSRIFNYLPMLTPGKVRELKHHDWVCDNRPIIEDTGWQPTVSLHEGLSKTVL